MKTKLHSVTKILTIFLMISILAMPIIIIAIKPVFAADVTLEVDPATSYVTLGKSFTVNLEIADVVGLTSWQFSLFYPKAILSCLSVSFGPFLETGGSTYPGDIITDNYDSTHGRLLAYDTLEGSTSVSGSGVLATITFYALADGDASLHLSETKLGDTAIPPNPITHLDVDGTVHVQSFTLTVNVVGTGCTVTRDHPEPYHYGETVQLTAVHANGWTFDHWTGAPAGNPTTTITITGDMTVTATFTEDQYTLTVNKVGHGTVVVDPLQTTYTYGTQVTLTETADAGWTFAGWTGAPAGNPTTTITITGDMTVTATFTEDQYTLTVNSAHGSVSKNPDQPTYTYGTSVTLTATPDDGWSFQYWSGASTDTTNTTTIIMTSSLTVTANYINKPTLQMSPTSKTCRVYHENLTVTVNVSSVANFNGYTFEIDYDTTMLDCRSVTCSLWGSSGATINIDEADGKITVSNSGTPTSGTQTLLTITFTASIYHIFKFSGSGPSPTNNLTSTIYFQTISISYPIGPPLQYSRGDQTQISVGPDFAYKFVPIQGDLDNNGIVDIFDLRTVAAYFGTSNPTYDLNNDGTIDVADIQIVAYNYDFKYVP